MSISFLSFSHYLSLSLSLSLTHTHTLTQNGTTPLLTAIKYNQLSVVKHFSKHKAEQKVLISMTDTMVSMSTEFLYRYNIFKKKNHIWFSELYVCIRSYYIDIIPFKFFLYFCCFSELYVCMELLCRV